MKIIILLFLSFFIISCSSTNIKDDQIKPKYEKINLTRSLVQNDKQLIEGLILNLQKRIVTSGQSHYRANNLLTDICINNKITVCPSLVIIDSSSVMSPYSTLSTIVVSQGTIDRIVSDDQLAFILAHETSHIIYGHTGKFDHNQITNGLKSFMEISQISYMDDTPRFPLVLNADPSAWAAGITSFMIAQPTLIRMSRKLETSLYKFDREMEYQADISGIDLIKNTNYNPREAINFWSNAKDVFGDDATENNGFGFGNKNEFGFGNKIIITKTHPTYGDREKRLNEYLTKNP